MSYKDYTELNVWVESRVLVSRIYNLTKIFPSDEQYGLVSQMRRCSVSIPSNIAEGCGRKQPKDSIRFFHIARGSIYELETQLYISFDLGYISKDELDLILKQVKNVRKLLSGFINYFTKLV